MNPVRQQIGGLGNLMFKQAYLYSQMRDGLIPDMYVQDERHFKKYAEEVKQMFKTKIGITDMVSLHIRRGDYLNTNFYIDLTRTNYYQEAAKRFSEDRFLVFCYDRQDSNQDKSDREWTKEFLDTFIKDRYEFWEPKSETDDLNKMSSCKSNIMANSTFSWWAAYLNSNYSKKVICPREWFTDGIQRCELLVEWTKI